MRKKQRADEDYVARIKFNIGEKYLIDQLVNSHIYGKTRGEVVKRLVDEGLQRALRDDLPAKVREELRKMRC